MNRAQHKTGIFSVPQNYLKLFTIADPVQSGNGTKAQNLIELCIVVIDIYLLIKILLIAN